MISKVLKDDGHFFLNMGYSNKHPWVGMDVAQQARDYFILQNNIIWSKSISIGDITYGHFKPINSKRYTNGTWEYLFHFTKTGNEDCDRLSIGVPYMDDSNLNRVSRKKGKLSKKLGYDNVRDFSKNATPIHIIEMQNELDKYIQNSPKKENKRCKGNTWHIPYDTIQNNATQKGSHPAVFPVALVEQCIKFSGKKAGILLDPFMGSGTSAVAAQNLNLQYVGYEIDSGNVDFSNERLKKNSLQKVKNIL